MNVSIVLKEDALWAKAGHEILKEQFALNDHLMAVANGVQPGKRKNKFSVLDLWKDSYFQAFRAPTDNDKSFGNWLAKDWKNQRLDAPQVEGDYSRNGNSGNEWHRIEEIGCEISLCQR